MPFVIDPATRAAPPVEPSTFLGLNVWERRGLQKWSCPQAGLLRQDVLIVTSEFDRVDNSKDRVDTLGVSHVGNLVVVELKSDQIAGHADLGAVQYAAVASGMTVAEVADALARTGSASGLRSFPQFAQQLVRDHIRAEFGELGG